MSSISRSGPSSTWIWHGVRAGESRAAQAAYDLYARQLMALLHGRMSGPLQRRVDPEDIVQSAFHSMLRGVRDGRFNSRRSGSFWRLLAQLTLNKLRRQIEHHTAARRHIEREQHVESFSDEFPAHPEPTPDDAVAAAEILANCLAQLPEEKQRVLQLRLEDHTLEEIAATVGRSERTIRRWLEDIRRDWTASDE